jgi:uncharacterized protein YciI
MTPLNDKPFVVYLILAETLAGWKNPSTAEGQVVLQEHYKWGKMLKSMDKLLLAGPTDSDLWAMRNEPLNIGHITGLIMLKVSSREEAEMLAQKDPFHIHGFRKNNVVSMKIAMTHDVLFEAFNNTI